MPATMRGSLFAAAAVLALLPLSPAPATAGELGRDESCSRADAHATQPHDDSPTRVESADAALAFEATRTLPGLEAPAAAADPLPAMLPDAGDEPPRPEFAAAPLAFRDSDAPREKARDLRRWRELKLLRVFDTRELMVWLGLDRKGRPGLHFRQRNPGEAMPEPTLAAYLVEPPPLRAVPLSSP